MGINDRDYMKRPPSDGGNSSRGKRGGRPAGTAAGIKKFLAESLSNNRRFIMFIGVSIVILLLLKAL